MTKDAEDSTALALALFEAGLVIERDPAGAGLIVAEIERLYVGADAREMRWLVAVLDGLKAMCATRGVQFPVDVADLV